MELPSLRQLEYFLAVATHLNFSEAAKASHVTQPALSAQIRQLEDLLQVQLLERDQRHVYLTAAGQELLEHTRRIIVQCQELVGRAHQFRKPLVGALRLGVIPTLAPYLVPGLMQMVKERFPELSLVVQESMTPSLLAGLAGGSLDVALLALEADLGNVETHELFTDRFLVIAGKDHWIADRDAIAESDLRNERVLLLDDGHCLRDQVLSLCGVSDKPGGENLRASSLTTLVQVVASGVGITLIPEIALEVERAHCRHREIVIRSFREPSPSRTVGLAWRKSSTRASEFKLLGTAIQHAREAMAPA